MLFTGGCLCGALRYEADGPPTAMGNCYCADCRKASGSGFIPFLNFPAEAVRITGQTLVHCLAHADGRKAVRNSCAVCGGLVFGGVPGESRDHTIYAGSLDDASLFVPAIAIFTRDAPAWAVIPPLLTRYDTMPG